MNRRNFLNSILLAVFVIASPLSAEDAAEFQQKGVAALKESQSNPKLIVEAARNFAKAAELFDKSGDTDHAVEMNSYLYWCKKKMTLQDMEAFVKGGETTVVASLKAVEEKKIEVSEAQRWFDRAEKYAKEKPDEHYLIAVRFFEVASRFIGTKESIAAQERSLKEQGLSLTKHSPQKSEKGPERPAVAKTGKTINLLALIDPAKDAVAGKWRISDGMLVGEKAESARIEIPFQPPEEYDFRIVFMRAEGDDGICQILRKSEHQFQWTMDGWKSSVSGIQMINDKTAEDNETTFKGKLIKNGQWHTSVVQVRHNGITVLFDGKPIAKYTKSYESLKLSSAWKLRDTSVIGLGHYQTKAAFSLVELVEITGAGKRTR